MKRFLSFMLALAMLASMAISASAAPQLYLKIDLDRYETIDDFLAIVAENSERNVAGAVSLRDAGTYVQYGSSNAVGDWSNTHSRFTTDANGIKWFEFLNTEGTSSTSRNGNFYVMPATTWDYVNTPGETYVISYDLKVNPLSQELEAKTAGYDITAVWASDDAGTGAKEDSFARLARTATTSADITLITYNSHSSGDSRGTDVYGVMTADTSYKLAVGYKYDETKDYPVKNVAVNGVINSTSDAKAGASNATPKLLGFHSLHNALMGEAIREFKMYTISNAANAFNVSRVGEGTIPATGATVTVKISQPVYAPSFDPDAVTIEGLVNGEDFLVSDVTEVATVGSEIYSTATVRFLTNLEDASDYTITFPATIKNEIGTELGTNNTVTVSTPEPEVVVSNQIITKAWGTDAAATVNTFAADGVYGVSQDIKNNTLEAKDFAVIYAVYAGGKLADVVYTSENIAAGETTTIGTGVKLENVAGGQVKSFIWDGLTSIKPHTEA
ncbi:MAG: hypothetical protein IKV80_06630, partial [Bacteroidales bacterium]|nr:hypothetical protein [Bacteroidales bacterium]